MSRTRGVLSVVDDSDEDSASAVDGSIHQAAARLGDCAGTLLRVLTSSS